MMVNSDPIVGETIVERLRNPKYWLFVDLPREAADVIDGLYAEVEKWKECYVAACVMVDDANENYQRLTRRYDDAMKRINDLTAELEYLRQEVNRG